MHFKKNKFNITILVLSLLLTILVKANASDIKSLVPYPEYSYVNNETLSIQINSEKHIGLTAYNVDTVNLNKMAKETVDVMTKNGYSLDYYLHCGNFIQLHFKKKIEK